MTTFKNIHYTKRDYECTNVVACVGTKAPDQNYVECDETVLDGLTQLWKENGVTYYGHI